MATTTASKAGLRAVATAKRTKAAQRTPLPAKDHAENVALAREAVVEAKSNGHKVKPAKARPPAPLPDLPDKAAGYVPQFAALGWETVVLRNNGLQELTASRGVEVIYLSWMANAHISGGSTYTYADRRVKVRNPAEALRIAGRQPDAAQAIQAKVSGNKMFRRRATGPKVGRIPFDPATVTDEEIVAAIAEHRISWHNSYRVESETATVGAARTIQISSAEGEDRIVSFVDPEFGFRAFRLGHLETVGRKIDLERIKQDILKSLARDDKKSKNKAS